MLLGLAAVESFLWGSSYLIPLAPASDGVEDCPVHREGDHNREVT